MSRLGPDKEIRVIVIDPFEKTITERVIANTYEALKAIIGGGIEGVVIPGRTNHLWVDEEFCLKGLTKGFWLPHYPTPMMGFGVITGITKGGENVSTTLDPLNLHWEFYEGPAPEPELTVTPINRPEDLKRWRQ